MTGNLLEEAVAPRLQRGDPNPKLPPYPWDDDRGFRCIRRIAPASSLPTRADHEAVPGPHQKEIEDLLHARCAECRSMEFLTVGGPFNIILASLDVPAGKLAPLLEQSDRLPRYAELGDKPRALAIMKQYENCARWWRPSELKEARYANKSWVTRHEEDLHFELLSGLSVVAGAAAGGWVHVYVCYEAEIVPRSL